MSNRWVRLTSGVRMRPDVYDAMHREIQEAPIRAAKEQRRVEIADRQREARRQGGEVNPRKMRRAK